MSPSVYSAVAKVYPGYFPTPSSLVLYSILTSKVLAAGIGASSVHAVSKIISTLSPYLEWGFSFKFQETDFSGIECPAELKYTFLISKCHTSKIMLFNLTYEKNEKFTSPEITDLSKSKLRLN